MVIDASSLTAYCLRERGFERIAHLLKQGAASIELVTKETCNAILMAKKRRLIGEGTAGRALQATLALSRVNVKMFPQTGLMDDAIKISVKEDVTIYDALYIALAKRLNATLASRDARQLDAAKKLGVRASHH